MKKFYLMTEKMIPDGTIIYQRSHDLIPLKTGRPLPEDFEGPFLCELDEDYPNGHMPTFYMSPALIAKRSFVGDLREMGIENVEIKPVLIRDAVNNLSFDDYVMVNILGRMSCADLARSDFSTLGDGMRVFNTLVLNQGRIHDEPDLFLMDEDTDQIVISERLYLHLKGKHYPDIHFEELLLT